MALEFFARIITFAAGAFSMIMLIQTILKMREETYVPKLAPIITIVTTSFIVVLYVILTGAPINWLLAVLLLSLGLLFGLAEGQMTRLYYRGPIIVGKRSVGYLILWGLAYLMAMALTQTGNAALHAVGVLTMMFGLGTALGDNLNLLVRQSTLKPQPAIPPLSGMPTPVPRPTDLPEPIEPRKLPKPTDLPK
jgi:hypothetical protein